MLTSAAQSIASEPNRIAVPERSTFLDPVRASLALREASPAAIIRWALALDRPALTSTSMGPRAAAMLHAVSREAPELPVVWVDHGFNLRETYRHADALAELLALNLKVYLPALSAEHILSRFGGIPMPDEPGHGAFTELVKLEPFERAVADLGAEVWITGIRAEETAFRRSLDIVTIDERGLIKVAPFFHWREDEIDAYMARHDLPTGRHYFDPTKGEAGRECGLHTR